MNTNNICFLFAPTSALQDNGLDRLVRVISMVKCVDNRLHLLLGLGLSCTYSYSDHYRNSAHSSNSMTLYVSKLLLVFITLPPTATDSVYCLDRLAIGIPIAGDGPIGYILTL